MKELNLLLQLPQDVSTRYRSVDMTVFAVVCRFPAFASGNSCFISSPVQKLKNSAKQNSWRVCRFSLWKPAGCVRIWLGAFGKAGLFGCQSGIRGLWLGAFGK